MREGGNEPSEEQECAEPLRMHNNLIRLKIDVPECNSPDGEKNDVFCFDISAESEKEFRNLNKDDPENPKNQQSQ